MSNPLFETLRFRVHVRNLLYDYVKKYCTIDYLSFTEGLVSEFFEDLQLVPLADHYSLTLPVDPLDTLEKIYSELPSYSPFDGDVCRLSPEAASYLKEIVNARSGKSKTDRVVMNDSYGPPPPEEPFYPALTRLSRQSTKKLGGGEARQPGTFKELFRESKLGILEVETVDGPTVDLEDTLKIKISIDPVEQPVVKSLLQWTLDTLRPQKPYSNRYLDSAFLCSQFPAGPIYTTPEDIFRPIFPRRRHIGSTAAANVEFADFKGLMENPFVQFEPVNIVNFDDEIPRQNLVLIDGWQAIKSSPPSTPLSKASGDDEIDELDDIQFPSSPCTTPPLVQEFEKPRIDQVLIPRCRRVGGKSGITPHILRGKTLKTFLAPLLHQTRTEEEEHTAERVPSPAPSSLIGQPPSAVDVDHGIESERHNLDFDVGVEIQKLCDGYKLEPDFFLNETLDEKAALLMEVPILPQPNEFPKDFYVPKSFSDLVIPSAAKGGQRQPNVEFLIYRFLKKVKGCQSLSLALSWVPFTANERPPTVVEILGVADLFLREGTEYKHALAFLDSVAAESPSESLTEVSVRRGLEAEPEDLSYEAPAEDFHIMLNRKERTRLDKADGSTSSVCKYADLDIPDVAFLPELQTSLEPSNIPDVDYGGHRDPTDASADINRRLKKRRRCIEGEQHSLDPGSPVEFAYSQTLVNKRGPDAGHDKRSTRSSSLSPPPAGPEKTRYYEPPTFSPPLDYPDSPMQGLQKTGDVAVSISLGQRPSGVPTDFDITHGPKLAKHSLGSFAFAQLRARKVSVPRPEPTPVEDLAIPPRTEEQVDLPRGPPPEVLDDNTISLSEVVVPQSIHKYMASLELIQKRALVYALCSRNCAIELIERRDLAGVDLILDTDTAIVFLNLFSLPALCNTCVDKIARGSWASDKLLVVLEAYNELSAKKQQRLSVSTSGQTAPCSHLPYAYTPPIVKALKKFKRDLSIAEACGTKRAATVIHYAFADTVEEAALLTRLYGDWCEAADRTGGAIWGNRDWLDADVLEDKETNLASLNGINHFSASIILCQFSLEEFIDLLPEERVSALGAYISVERIRDCNEDLAARFAAIDVAGVEVA